MKSDKEKFAIANNIEFYDACLDFYDGIDKQRRNPLQTVGDRVRLIAVLEAKGFTIDRIKGRKKGSKPAIKSSKKTSDKEVTVRVAPGATVEVINFDKNTSWVRWYFPDFSDNGNINLPKGKNYELKERVGNKVIVKQI